MTRAIPALMCSIMAIAVPSVAQAPDAAAAPAVVVAQGDATVRRAPDRAWISMSIDARDTRAENARETGARAMAALQAALKQAGVAADAMRTTGYSLVPEVEWTNGRSVPKGYVAHNQIDVRVDDLDRLAAVMDAANASGSTTVTVGSPRFDLKDESAAEADALRTAVQVATSRAEAMAAGAHRTLGAIRRIEQQTAGPVARPMPFAARAVAAAPSTPTPIDPGEIEIDAAVVLTVELR